MHHCWYNGTIQKVEEVQIGINDLGLMRGFGLFDYFRTYNQRVFQWDWYWERYSNSSQKLRIPNPISKEAAFKIVNELITAQGTEDCAIRFLLTGGYTEDSVKMTAPNLFIVSEDLHHSAPEEYQKGIKVISNEYVRDMFEIKSTDYKQFMFLQADIKTANASDVLFHKNGDISELSRSNVFIINGNTLATPDTNILKGITRRTVLELAKADFKIEERAVSFQEVLVAEEVFTTSTTKRVLPISQVDDHIIGNGSLGPKTQFLLDKINAMVEGW
jgi:branched-chain amino acid aminotransferase